MNAESTARFPSALIDRVRLADGREVIVRPVLPIDAQAEQQFVRGLSAESRRKRFHTPIRELPASLLRQLTEVDHDAHVAIVAEALDSDDAATIVADARYVRDGDETHLAIAVADAWQGIGLGRALMQRLLRYAARHGVARLVADVMSGNTAMTRLAKSFGGRLSLSPNGPGVTRAHLDLAGGGALPFGSTSPREHRLEPFMTSHARATPLSAPIAAALALSLAAGCGSEPQIPRAIAAGANESHAMTVAARGVQIYECRSNTQGTSSWALVGPDAELFDDKGRHVGHHGLGPHWQGDDGSRIEGRLRARTDAPQAGAIPWLLLDARSNGAQGVFARMTSVQRVNTVGGAPPATGCTGETRGAVVRVDYEADYRLFALRTRSEPSFAPY